jgi:2'-5' RNA ligase
VRTFVAVRPPPAALAHLQAQRARWPSAPERWHLTLAFLGEVAAPHRLTGPLGAVCAATSPFRLHLAGSGTFGRSGPVWVGVGGDVDELTDLAEAVADACRGAGVDVERRRYRPHLTVGRRASPDPRSLSSYSGPDWPVDEVELVVSHLGRTVRHEVVERLPLGTARVP